MSEEWTFAQTDPSQQLARLHRFSILKRQETGDLEFEITVREYVAAPDDRSMRFFAQADKPTNQKTAPYLASGWGNSLLKALSECIREIGRFPYEGDDAGGPGGTSGAGPTGGA